MDVVKQAEAFELKPLTFKTTSERIEASREVKGLILGVNEIYKTSKDPKLMDLMKRLTAIKQKIEKRLKGRPLHSMKKIIIIGGSKGIGKAITESLLKEHKLSISVERLRSFNTLTYHTFPAMY